MNNVKNRKVADIMTAAFSLFGLYVLYCFWMIQDEKNYLWGIFYGVLLGVFLTSFWGIVRKKYWAILLSYAFLSVAFALGIYLVHFVWTFWIFEEPTILERILSVLHPRISVFILLPALWLAFFNRKENKALFHQ